MCNTKITLQEDAWRTKCLEAETTIASLKDTCGKLDALADSLEEDNRKFREENSKLRVRFLPLENVLQK